MDTFSLADKLVFLRYSRLGRLPPARNAAELIAEAGLPLLVVEYGNAVEDVAYVRGKIPRRRLQARWAQWLPSFLRNVALEIGALFTLSQAITREGAPRLLMAHGIREQALAWALNRLFGIPYAIHVHEAYEPWELRGLNRFFLALEGVALRRARFLIFPEITRAALYQKRYRFSCPLFMAFNCPRLRHERPLRQVRKHWQLPKEALIIGYFGGIGPSALLETVIAALGEFENLYLFLWGWGEPEYLEQLKHTAQKHGVQDRVRFLGQAGKDKWDMLGSCDISYCIYDGKTLRLRYAATASNKLMEALAAGVPVLTSGQADFRDIVERYDIGACVTLPEVGSLAMALRELTAEKGRLRRKGRNARKLHEQQFHYEKQYQAILDYLNEEFFRSSAARRAAS